jgi:thiamine-phosphate pyrophosphorylase
MTALAGNNDITDSCDKVYVQQSDAGDELSALRMLDANLNRATEGLRVVEDYCRFALSDAHLTARWKQLRHDLVAALKSVPASSLAAARQTQTDVGVAISTPQEQQRHSLAHIAAAAAQRVQQALRVTEECLKLVAPASAAQVEALRYESYTLAKACTIAADSSERLAAARLYVLTDGAASECAFVERVQSLIEAGVHVIQLRDKNLDDRTLLARARLLRQIIDDTSAERGSGRGCEGEKQSSLSLPLSLSPPLFIVNDRPDIALLVRADGVHVGQDELSVHDARQIVGPDALIGVSTHTIEQARQAVLEGANYLGCGPTFPSSTKHFDHFPGLEFLRQVAAEISLPAFAIGGIAAENVRQVLAAGFSRIAVGGAIVDAEGTVSAAGSLLKWLTSPASTTLCEREIHDASDLVE